ncbi:MAG: pyridoxamine 5'-phosphate oxidase family protein [Myxococcales bacterium]|nr:pyridoxamine 5'-phosphate oxidase family protein [Myxococcales bacterium]
MSDYAPTARTTLHRRPARAAYDRDTVHAILDEALVCHLGFAVDGQPFVLPTTFAREGERLVVHGAAAGRLMRHLAGGAPACLTVTLLDGLVLARTAFHHSMNYRSVVVLGTAREIVDRTEKRAAVAAIVDKVSPGRSQRARPPNDKEIDATAVLSLPIAEVSAKIRSGPPLDGPEDAAIPVWAGVLPLALAAGRLEPDGPGGLGFEEPERPAGLLHLATR